MKRRVRLVEIWRPVVGFEDHYAISNHGRVMRLKATSGTRAGRILLAVSDKDGYNYVTLHKNRKRKRCKIYHLVLETFTGPRPLWYECNHIDGRKNKDYEWNLEWVTRSINQKHKCDVLRTGSNQAKAWHVTTPVGKTLSIKNLAKFCREKHLSQGCMVSVAQGRRKQHKGWSCNYG